MLPVSSRVANGRNNNASPIGGHARRGRAAALQEHLLKRQGRLAILVVMLALAACAQAMSGQTPSPYSPDSPQNGRDRNMGM